MACPIHLGNVLCWALKALKTLYHICKCLAQKYGLFLLKSEVFNQWLSTWFEKWSKWQRVIGQNIAHNHSRLTITILPCTAYTVIVAFLRALSARNLWETHACYTKKPVWSRKRRWLAISRSFEFPFCFSEHAYTCIFFYTDAIEINWKSIPWNKKSSCK